MWDENYSNYIIFLYFPLGNLPIENKILLSEQTTQDFAKHWHIQLNSATEKPTSFDWKEIGFSVFLMNMYTTLVNIRHVIRIHKKREDLILNLLFLYISVVLLYK